MNLLVMGGTQFLGRAIVDAAVAAGHTVTLFNRGKTGVDLFPSLEKLRGDRKDGNLTALQGRTFDAVIDVCAFFPRVVRELLETVKTAHYTLISTISVYGRNDMIGADESAELATLDDHSTEEVTGETYGGLKVLCEQAAEAALPEQVLHVRSGLIIGPHDPTDRFTYWPVRVARGGKMLAPKPPDYALQVIDARDQAAWIIRSIEANVTGVFNVAGDSSVTLKQIIDTTCAMSGSAAEVVWISAETIAEHEIQPWQELPLYVRMEGYEGFHHYSIDKALATGLVFRPIADTIRDILTWYDLDQPLKIGLKPEREAEILQKIA
ncbi:MAG: NAD-dependent epimerase/dehydratase family protein [Candidatus Promineifilaceae bacterium]